MKNRINIFTRMKWVTVFVLLAHILPTLEAYGSTEESIQKLLVAFYYKNTKAKNSKNVKETTELWNTVIDKINPESVNDITQEKVKAVDKTIESEHKTYILKLFYLTQAFDFDKQNQSQTDKGISIKEKTTPIPKTLKDLSQAKAEEFEIPLIIFSVGCFVGWAGTLAFSKATAPRRKQKPPFKTKTSLNDENLEGMVKKLSS